MEGVTTSSEYKQYNIPRVHMIKPNQDPLHTAEPFDAKSVNVGDLFQFPEEQFFC